MKMEDKEQKTKETKETNIQFPFAELKKHDRVKFTLENRITWHARVDDIRQKSLTLLKIPPEEDEIYIYFTISGLFEYKYKDEIRHITRDLGCFSTPWLSDYKSTSLDKLEFHMYQDTSQVSISDDRKAEFHQLPKGHPLKTVRIKALTRFDIVTSDQ